ncbi:hypothetical protein [uncultured Microscilla sp.]|uniref:hypothetical protein n=1 Tax=uncultured Microscilla sp. TaxID=432653 RepID=UPI002603EEAC|nr:hypothetical protein [uncultured Microscilla sp.]
MNTFKDPFANMSGFAFFLCFTGGVALIGLLGWVFGTPGKQIAPTYKHLLDNYTKDSSFTSPQFRIKKGQSYRLELKGEVIDNDWIVVGLSILNEEDDVINEKEVEFWHASGHDSDGSWSERDDIEAFHFKAKKTEKISVEVYWINDGANDFWRQQGIFKESEIWNKQNLENLFKRQTTTISFTLKKAGGALVSKYFQYVFWIFGGLFLLAIIMEFGDTE